MHEWALAESIAITVMKEAFQHNLKRIARVNLQIGELQQIDLEVFRFALESFLQSQDWGIELETVVVETVRSALQCRNCGNQWLYNDGARGLEEKQAEAIHFLPEAAHAYLKCPACGSPDFAILQGRGVWIESIEGEG